MFRSYLITALRNLWKNKTYTALNVIGLAIGLASCLLILLYVLHEISYDSFHKHADRIVRVGFEVSLGTGTKPIASTGFPVASALATDFPILERVTHFSRVYAEEVAYQDKKFRENRISFADSVFFEMFDFDFVRGDPASALDAPNTVVITQSIAEKYFGDDEPVGKRLRIGAPYNDDVMDLTISSVIEDMPANAHFHMDFIVSMATGRSAFPQSLFRWWGWDSQYTYALLPPGYSPEQFNQDLIAFGNKHIKGDWFVRFFAQKLTDIHLTSKLNSEIEPNGDITYVRTFSVVALIILLIACVNYMNLATAKSVNRSREVGVRKAMGAQRTQLMAQFLGESLVIALMALLTAFLLAGLALPFFENISGKDVSPDQTGTFRLLALFTSLALGVGFVAGSYPALFLSSFRPARVLGQSVMKMGSGPLFVRKGLVALQFALSIGLIIGTIVVYKQLHFLRSKNLGADTEHVVIMPAQTSNITGHYDAIRNELLGHPNIVAVTSSDRRIGRDINHGVMLSAQTGEATPNRARISWIAVDWDFFELFDISIKSGRTFSRTFPADTTIGALVLNQSAVQALGLKPERIVGQVLEGEGANYKVIGVAEDFHFEVLYNRIKPMAFFLNPGGMSWISVKTTGADIAGTLAHIQKTWELFEPDRIFMSSFLDESLYSLYIAEQRFLTVFTIFSGLAIFTACLGMFGLASFTATQRTREIGIRKVLGATALNVVTLLTREFSVLVGIAFVAAVPISHLAMRGWLQDFAYRTEMNAGAFLVAGIAALIIAWLTVGYQSIKAALSNPAEALKYE